MIALLNVCVLDGIPSHVCQRSYYGCVRMCDGSIAVFDRPVVRRPSSLLHTSLPHCGINPGQFPLRCVMKCVGIFTEHRVELHGNVDVLNENYDWKIWGRYKKTPNFSFDMYYWLYIAQLLGLGSERSVIVCTYCAC